MSKTLDLRGLSDAERDAKINRAVAEHVDGFVWAEDIADMRSGPGFKKGTITLVPRRLPDRSRDRANNCLGWLYPTKAHRKNTERADHFIPRYSASPDLVIPLIEQCGEHLSTCFYDPDDKDWTMELLGSESVTMPTFALAACVMLLQERGVKVLL